MKHPDVEFLLPGTWRFVQVADESASKRAIARMTESTVGRSDDRARLRAEIRARFTAAADRARAAGGEAMWICDEITPGVPLPASIVLYRPALAIRSSAGEVDRRTALHELIGPPRDGAVAADLTVAGQPAVRWSTLTAGPATDEPDAPSVETVECDYWIVQPDSRVLLLSMACGMPRLRDKVVQLFDLLAATLRWQADPVSDSTPPAIEPAATISA